MLLQRRASDAIFRTNLGKQNRIVLAVLDVGGEVVNTGMVSLENTRDDMNLRARPVSSFQMVIEP